MLGARAPSPATSAQRETALPRTPQELGVLRTLVAGEAPALPGLTCFAPQTTFWAVPVLIPRVTEAMLKKKGRPPDLPFHFFQQQFL